jgi:uncharacterized membrane protein
MLLLRGLALVLATLTTGLIAGLFYTFSCAVMGGLSLTDDRTYVFAMQKINIAIINGWFFLSFLGSLGLGIVAAILNVGQPGFWWIVAGVVLNAVQFVITSAVNVPMNNRLEAAGPPDQLRDAAGARAAFDRPWRRWNNFRTLLCTAAFACLTIALIAYGGTVA